MIISERILNVHKQSKYLYKLLKENKKRSKHRTRQRTAQNFDKSIFVKVTIIQVGLIMTSQLRYPKRLS